MRNVEAGPPDLDQPSNSFVLAKFRPEFGEERSGVIPPGFAVRLDFIPQEKSFVGPLVGLRGFVTNARP